ncbi:unnamed protein product [Closterium sp. Naga37s-1]|nr:unnamed protein product [Closterium sp. Naga37s-1]
MTKDSAQEVQGGRESRGAGGGNWEEPAGGRGGEVKDGGGMVVGRKLGCGECAYYWQRGMRAVMAAAKRAVLAAAVQVVLLAATKRAELTAAGSASNGGYAGCANGGYTDAGIYGGFDPPATEELPDWLSDFSPSEVPQLTIPLLHQALRSAPRGTAAGPSGWLIEHLRDTFLSYQSHLPHLLRLFQNWLQGDLPQTVRPYFTASTLVALQKPQGGVRPIAIGEILPRLLSRCVTLHFKQQIRDFFLPSLQFGVAVSAGIEVMAHAVQSALSLHPEWVVLELDVANAFNSFSRSAMFNALRDSPFSSLIPFFRLFYASPSSLHYRSGPLIETLQSSSGVRQGDPCGPFLFALTQHLAIRPIQRQSPALFITSYADDTYMVGPAHDVFPAYTALTARLNNLGLRVQPSKCSLWAPLDLPSDLTPPSDIVIAPNGLTVAGVPIGSDTHIISTVRDKLHSFSSSLPLLHDLHDPQTASRLLTLCISARPSFLLRTVAPFP